MLQIFHDVLIGLGPAVWLAGGILPRRRRRVEVPRFLPVPVWLDLISVLIFSLIDCSGDNEVVRAAEANSLKHRPS